MPTRRFRALAPVVALAATLAATLAAALSAATPAGAQLRDGFRATTVPRGDDAVSPFAAFGFAVHVRGGRYTSASACMNGYLTLGVPFEPGSCPYQGQFTGLSTLPHFADLFGTAVVALFRDLDSSAPASGLLGYGAGVAEGRRAFGFTWDGVFTFGSSARNTFQLVLVDRAADFTDGDFDLEYNYGAVAVPGGVAGLADDGGFSGAAYAAAVTPAANTRRVQCFRGGSAAACAVPVAVIPEPSAAALTLAGLAALAAARRRRRTPPGGAVHA